MTGKSYSLSEQVQSALDKPLTQSADLQRFHKLGRNSIPLDVIDSRIVEDLLAKYFMFVLNGVPYIYINGCYRADKNGTIIKSIIGQYIDETIRTEPKISRVYKLLVMTANIQITEDLINNHPKNWINFENGMLDCMTLELHSHSPEFRSINQIPHNWQRIPNAEESFTYKYLKSMFDDEEDIKMFLEYIGYSMSINTDWQKLMILSGSGGLGKSLLLRMVKNAVGMSNISSLTLQNLNDRFSPAFLFGKVLNMNADLSSADMNEVSGIKTITGGDAIRAEIKGGEVFSFIPYCKLLYSANQIPKSRDDQTTAYYRRLLILRVTHRGTEISDIENRLQADIASFITLAVLAYHRTCVTGQRTVSKGSQRAVTQLYHSTDTVAAYLHECITITGDRDNRIQRKALYDSYTGYCQKEGRTPLGQNSFYENARSKGISEMKSNGERYFIGLKYDYQRLNE